MVLKSSWVGAGWDSPGFWDYLWSFYVRLQRQRCVYTGVCVVGKRWTRTLREQLPSLCFRVASDEGLPHWRTGQELPNSKERPTKVCEVSGTGCTVLKMGIPHVVDELWTCKGLVHLKEVLNTWDWPPTFSLPALPSTTCILHQHMVLRWEWSIGVTNIICSACGECLVLRSRKEIFFHSFWLFEQTYWPPWCLNLEIWRFIDDNRRQTKLIALPLVHACRVIITHNQGLISP